MGNLPYFGLGLRNLDSLPTAGGISLAAHVPALLPKSINVRESTLRAVKEEQERGVKRAREEDDHDAGEARKKAASHPGYYKTELCNKWEEQGQCPYGPKCQFAHGIEELRPVLRHPKFKTEICRLVANGYKCPYGHRCHFRHSIEGDDVPVL
ncbi:CCCH-type Zn-finger protein [Klebsormidium nitens]|uniref:CCCH-type Zn-finger protein n=1 Tax=Klebsormidium nitens TaxID=105231 RepID=A0A1Y1HR26_KLENI|nr:CCCH-type Zn-finger protein [Klebsormidium nitens]|eukprot:GAQ80543.1 CCCH-type Zn-finger protein [Klebsormidium nitens]